MSQGQKRHCTVCKHLSLDASQIDLSKLEPAELYYEEKSVRITLCRSHAAELFKVGQSRFLLNYVHILKDVINSDEPDFLDALYRELKNSVSKSSGRRHLS